VFSKKLLHAAVWQCLFSEDNEYQAATLQSVDFELHLVTGGDDDIFFLFNDQLDSGKRDKNMQSCCTTCTCSVFITACHGL